MEQIFALKHSPPCPLVKYNPDIPPAEKHCHIPWTLGVCASEYGRCSQNRTCLACYHFPELAAKELRVREATERGRGLEIIRSRIQSALQRIRKAA